MFPVVHFYRVCAGELPSGFWWVWLFSYNRRHSNSITSISLRWFLMILVLSPLLKIGEHPNRMEDWCQPLSPPLEWVVVEEFWTSLYFLHTDGKMCKLYLNCSQGFELRACVSSQASSSVFIKPASLMFKYFPLLSPKIYNPWGKVKCKMRNKDLQEMTFL